MKKIISFKSASLASIIIFSILVLFHLAVIIGIIIFDYVPLEFLWGGRMESSDQLLSFEIVSVVVSFICILVVMIRSKRIEAYRLMKTSRLVLWVLFVMFLLNTIGNIFAETTFEKCLSIVTFVLAILCLRMALEDISKY